MIRELEKMCLQKDFDISKSKDIIRKTDVNQVFKSSKYNSDTTFLDCAVDGVNYTMVELLLKHGSDPNLVYGKRFHEENVFWDLQYSSGDADEDEIRLAIVRLFLENGANPHLKVDGEDLYHWATACWQDDMGIQAEYRSRFIDLLEDYGA